MFRQRLLEDRNQLLTRYRNELDLVDEIDKTHPEPVEHATEIWDAQTLARVGEADARHLGEVVAALRRIEDGTYGTCVTCGDPIGILRLEALPTARQCMSCADPTHRPRHVRVRGTN